MTDTKPEIEVLWVPDDRLKCKPEYDLTDPPGYTLNAMSDGERIPVAWEGDVVLVYDGDIEGGILVSGLAKPALLAALLKDAGAERISIPEVYDELNGEMVPGRAYLEVGHYWLLREGGGTT